MTEHALLPWRRRTAVKRTRTAALASYLVCYLVCCAILAIAPPASAQIGGSLTLSSQARLRGRPVSDHRPVLEVELVHDEPSGLYLGGSAALVASRDWGVQPLAFTQYAGFARRLADDTVLDIGIVHNGYTEYSGIADGGSYTEAYVGLIGRHRSGRLFLSPGYFRKDEPTLYAEVEGNIGLAPNWLLFGHAGLLTHLRDRQDESGAVADWRIGIRRHIGRVDIGAVWTGYATDRAAYDRRNGSGGALLVDLALAF